MAHHSPGQSLSVGKERKLDRKNLPVVSIYTPSMKMIELLMGGADSFGLDHL